MSFFSSTSYKPQVRQEGFHLPSPPPSNPSPPPNNANGPFDPANIFIPHFLPDPFRPKTAAAPGDPAPPSMDFSDELASLMAHSPPPHAHHQSNERSTHSPDLDHHQPSQSQPNGYDTQGYRHNIFDISAPTSFSSSHHHHPQQYTISHRPDLPPLAHPSSFHTSSATDSYSPTSASGPPPHFNSTLPALSSSLRYDPHDPASYSSSSQAIDAQYRTHHTPSPSGRSRSRSRQPTEPGPPSTHGGPARTSRAKRGSISSASPPRHHPHAIVIPSHSHSRANGNGNGGTPTLPVSPLSMHSLGGGGGANGSAAPWFAAPGSSHQNGGSEYNLPTPESLGHGTAYGSFGTQGGVGVSPKDLGMGLESPVAPAGAQGGSLDAATKQAMLANEKRRRRRESHNAVERRRRDNINEKISELATLIPECLLDGAASQAPTSPTPDDIIAGNLVPQLPAPASPSADDGKDPTSPGAASSAAGPDGAVKANKGMILRKSVDYIRYLQQLVSAQASRNRELEAQLSAFRGSSGSGSVSGDEKSTAGSELMLHEDEGAGRLAGVLEDDGELMEMEMEVEDGGNAVERGRARRRGPGGKEDVVVKEEDGGMRDSE
ncbi:HLH-domain-containing protein [Dentipellis sp. KUC8613]|nr:HLH-domain-containing protein [Dentipellis sp. KUC8613]